MKNTILINEIHALYDAYIKKVKELERNKKITDGLFGITKGPKDDPCHDQFANDLSAKLQEFAAADPDPEEVRDVLDYMYAIPFQYKDNHLIYWMFLAVHTLAVDLIPRLESSDASAIYDKYNSEYPRRDRLPAQKKTLKALKDRAG